MGLNRTTQGGILVGILLIVMGAFMLWRYPVRLVVVDMKRAIEQPALFLSRSTMPEAEQEVLMQRYSSVLPEVIKAYGESHHVMIVAAPIIVSQRDIDITNQMIEQTLERLKQQRLKNHG